MKLLVSTRTVAAVFLLIPGHGYGQTVIDHDAVIDANNSIPDSGISVVDGEGPSVVQIIEGGQVATNSRTMSRVAGTSELEFKGGLMGGPIEAQDHSRLVLSAGSIELDPDVPVGPDTAIRVDDFAEVVVVDAIIDHYLIPIQTSAIVASGNSSIRIEGGLLTSDLAPTLIARGSSGVRVDGGELRAKEGVAVLTDESGTVDIYGGTIVGGEHEGGIRTRGESLLNVYGGAISEREGDGVVLWIEGSSTVSLFGGVITSENIAAHMTGSGTFNIRGGSIRAYDDGEREDGLVIAEAAIVNVFGYDLSQSNNVLSGLLLDGSLLDLGFDRRDNGQVNLFEMDKPALPGDLNQNTVEDPGDIDLLAAAVRYGITAEPFDLDGNGAIDASDVNYLIDDVFQAWRGDSDVDGEFNSADLIKVLSAGEYEDHVVGNSGWSTGDWNGDADFTSADLVIALADGGYEQGPRASVAVPEPSTLATLLVGFIAVASVPGTRRRPF